MERSPTEEIVEKLVHAFGRPDDIVSLLAEDAVWWISPTTGLPSPMQGRKQIHETLRQVFGAIYDPARTSVDVHMVLGKGTSASIRFTLRSHVVRNDRPYENEYAIFVQLDGSGEKVERVWEYVDVKHAMDQLGGGDPE